MAARIAAEVGFPAAQIREIEGLGAVNRVFVAKASSGSCVVRFNRDPLDNDDFAKEEFCLGFARRIGIPSPHVIARGELQDIPYLVQSFIAGESGEYGRSPELWRQLGHYAAVLASEPVPKEAHGSLFPRFGRDPAENWRLHVQYNLDELTPQDRLIELGAYDLAHQDHLRTVFEALGKRTFRFGLNHGDLVPKNTVVQPDGTVVLLDWGSASVGLSPETAFLRLRNPAPTEQPFSEDEIAWFAEGYGVDAGAVSANLQDVELLGAIDLVRWAIGHRPDRLEEIVAKARAHVRARIVTRDNVIP